MVPLDPLNTGLVATSLLLGLMYLVGNPTKNYTQLTPVKSHKPTEKLIHNGYQLKVKNQKNN